MITPALSGDALVAVRDRRTQPVKRLRPDPLLDTGGDPGLQLLRGPLGERERDDARRVRAADHELGEMLRDYFGLAGIRRGDDPHVGPPADDTLCRWPRVASRPTRDQCHWADVPRCCAADRGSDA